MLSASASLSAEAPRAETRNTGNWAAKARWSSLAAKTMKSKMSGFREHLDEFRRLQLPEVTALRLVLTTAKEWQNFENLAVPHVIQEGFLICLQ